MTRETPVVRYDSSFAGWCAACARLLDEGAPEPWFWSQATGKGEGMLFDAMDIVAAGMDEALLDRFFVLLRPVGGIALLSDLFYLFLSEAADRETLMFRMVRISLEQGRRGRLWHSHPDARRAGMLIDSTRREAHRARGLLRFSELGDGTLYARHAPKHDVTPLVVGHFRRRMPGERWVIHDEARGYGMAWDGSNLLQVNQFPADVNSLLSDAERRFRACWQTFFRELAVPERHNPRLQRHFLPERFRKYLPELAGDRLD